MAGGLTPTLIDGKARGAVRHGGGRPGPVRRKDMERVTYVGVRVDGIPLAFKVWLNRVIPLDMRNELYNHSPDGPNWGYSGSGPAQLALAILADFAGPTVALRQYQTFKRAFVQNWDKDGWVLAGSVVRVWLDALEPADPEWESNAKERGEE